LNDDDISIQYGRLTLTWSCSIRRSLQTCSPRGGQTKTCQLHPAYRRVLLLLFTFTILQLKSWYFIVLAHIGWLPMS